MRPLALSLALTAAASPVARAQNGTDTLLQQAESLYEQLEIERALPLLRQLVSPSWPHAVTQDQRVLAYTYLGASLALVGRRDSALLYFRSAIERDPFAVLDPRRFTPAQLALFREARRSTFAVAARPVTAGRIDPRTGRVTFTVVTTHVASLRVELRSGAGSREVELFHGVNDGMREVSWDGLVLDGRLAPPGRYALAVFARSNLLGRPDSGRVYFTLAHDTPPLEDTLPDLGSADLLPERFQPSAGRGDFLKGIAVAAGALTLSTVAANGDLPRGGRALALAVAGTATIAGVAAFARTRREREVPANVAENARRRAARHAANADMARRNAERTAQTVLVILPAAGVGP